MALKTQGSQLYIIDPDASGGPEILTVECATSITGISASRDQIETTCLESPARTYEAGLAAPGSMSVTVSFDPTNESHVRLHELYTAGTKFDAALGLSDGTAAPTLDTDGEFVLPTTRSWLLMLDTFVQDYPFDLALNTVITSNMSLQLSGFPTVFPKA